MSLMRLAPYLGRTLSLVILLPWLMRALQRDLRRFNAATVAAIGGSLHLAPGRAQLVFQQSLRSFVRFNINHFFLCRRTARELRQEIDAIRVIGNEKLVPFLTGGQPVLVITIHMGSFQLGFLKLVASIRSERKVFVFKISDGNANEDAIFAAFERESQQIHPLRAGQDGGRRAYLELRKGNVVTMTVDLEVNVTSRSDVAFFGKRCHMQNGPATLAALTRAVIVPIINYIDASGVSTIRVEDPINTQAAFVGESSKDLIDRVTQQIAGLMESWIRIDPTQVHAWSALAETIHKLPST